MKKNLIFIIILLFFVNILSAQKIKSIKIEQLENIINTKNDTLKVVNFWASWCVPCVKELPYFSKLSLEMKSKPIQFIFVAVEDTEEKALNLLKKKKLTIDSYLLDEANANKWIDKIDKNWDGAIPFTLIISSKNIIKKHQGELSEQELRKMIEE
ncbi:MAG: TlpA family protein disulfide reductase [Bacteroidetes bacterium]|nr:MAG: TlpA family protein disulfide reductase [Bacteroidota bacterium]TAG87302.1 MAG: TlpA family protein disulfide reductase [Bacteroidota bacterium]